MCGIYRKRLLSILGRVSHYSFRIWNSEKPHVILFMWYLQFMAALNKAVSVECAQMILRSLPPQSALVLVLLVSLYRRTFLLFT